RENAYNSLQCCNLRWAKMRGSTRREDEHTLVVIMQLKGVAGEVLHLLASQLDDSSTAFLQLLANMNSVFRPADHVEPDQREGGSNAHHNIGVIDQPTVGSCTLKGQLLEPKISTESFQRFAIGPL